MIRIITGVPGAGKTLFAVSEILSIIHRSRKDGDCRPIYTNIDGISIDGVDPLDSLDWRDYPPGSLIVYDEAHQIFRASGRAGLSDDPVINAMDEHRHRGYDLWFISQFPTKIHHEIRHMADEHCHLLRQFGSKASTLYRWPESVDVKDAGQRQVADKSRFRFPKHAFKLYKSASEHTDRLRIPARLKAVAVVVAVIVAFVGWRVSSSGGFASFSDASSGATSSDPDYESMVMLATATAEPTGDAAERPGGAALPPHSVVGCIASATQCRCYDADLVLIQQPDYACRNLLGTSMLTGRRPTDGV